MQRASNLEVPGNGREFTQHPVYTGQKERTFWATIRYWRSLDEEDEVLIFKGLKSPFPSFSALLIYSSPFLTVLKSSLTTSVHIYLFFFDLQYGWLESCYFPSHLSIIHPVFIGLPLCARQCDRHWGYTIYEQDTVPALKVLKNVLNCSLVAIFVSWLSWKFFLSRKSFVLFL